jgi:hypothetical protein
VARYRVTPRHLLPNPVFWAELGLFAAVGIPGLIGATGTLSLLQAWSPDAYRGRIFGAEGAIGGPMVLIGAVAAGTLPQRIGLLPVFSGQGIAKTMGRLISIALLPAFGALKTEGAWQSAAAASLVQSRWLSHTMANERA